MHTNLIKFKTSDNFGPNLIADKLFNSYKKYVDEIRILVKLMGNYLKMFPLLYLWA